MVFHGYNNTQGKISKLYNNQIGKGGIVYVDMHIKIWGASMSL